MHSVFEIQKLQPPIELWLEYCIERGLTPDILAPLNGSLLTIEQASKVVGTGIFGFKGVGAVGAYVFPLCPDQYQARLIYGPEPEIPGVITQTKPKKRPKYYRPKNSVNVLFVPPHLTDWRTPSVKYNLLIVEGALNATRLASQGYHAVAITGVYNYRIGGKHTPIIPELEWFVKSENAETITVLFDSDADDEIEKRELWVGRNKLCEDLMLLRQKRSDTILICSPPARDDGSKQGPDDFLHNAGIDEFNRLLIERSLRYNDNDYLKVERKSVERFISDDASGMFFDTRNRQLITTSHANTIMNTFGRVDDITANRPTKIIYDHRRLLAAPGLRVATGLKFQPDIDDIFFLDETVAPPVYRVNKFQPEDVPQAIKGDVSIAYEMIGSICRNTPSAVQKLLTIAAKHAQCPALTPKYGLLLTGQQGSGKSTLARLIGLALSKRYHSARVNLSIDFNAEWRGFAAKEWAEFDKDMDEEWLKDLITSETYDVSVKYGRNYTENNHTLNIFTCNGLQAKIQEGDRRFLVCGEAKADNKRLGLEFEAWVNSSGPNHFRYHLLNEIDCSPYDLLDVWTEMKDAVIEASKSYRSTVMDYVMEECEQIDGLECIPNVILQSLLDAHKVNIISFNKEFGQHFIKPAVEKVKIDGIPQRFRAFKNHEYWRQIEDTDVYRKQWNLAQKLLSRSKL